MKRADCDQLKKQLEAYVLGALDADEQAEVEHHLAHCSNCQQQVAELAEIAHALPQALAQASSTQPPASLKQNLLQAIEEDSNARAIEQPKLEPETGADAKPSFTSSANQKPKSARPAKAALPWWRRRTASLVAVLILLLLAVALGTQLSIVLAEGRALQAELSTLIDQQEVVLEVVDSEGTVKRFLRSQIPADNPTLPAYGKLYSHQELPHVVAMAARLPQPPAGQAYHLWLTEDDQTRLAGVLEVNEQGFGLLVFDEDSSNPTYDQAQLTLQPLGSTTPTDNLILLWQAPEP